MRIQSWSLAACVLVLGVLLPGVVPHQTYYIDAVDKAFAKVFNGPRSQFLSTIPLCLELNATSTLHTVSNSTIESRRVNLTWPQYTDLMRNRRKSPVDVGLLLSLLQIVEVSEKQQSLSLAIQHSLTWTDCRLHWTHQDSTAEQIVLTPTGFKARGVYVPDIQLREEVGTSQKAEDCIETSIFYTGKIWLVRQYVTTIQCAIDVEMYPFDIQQCKLSFDTQLDDRFINLTYSERPILTESQYLLRRFTPDDMWSVALLPPITQMRKSCSIATKPCYKATLVFRLILRRHPNYELINLVVPASLVVLISSFVFITPPEYSGKMELSITILLSMFIFTQIMYEKMPETGWTLPLLSHYFVINVVLIACSCIFAAISALLAAAVPAVPRWLGRLVKAVGPYLMVDLVSRPRLSTLVRLPISDNEVTPSTFQSCSPGAQESPSETLRINSEEPEQLPHTNENRRGFQIDDVEKITWAAVAVLADRCFFILHALSCIIILVIILVYGYSPWSRFSRLNLSSRDMQYVCAQLAMQRGALDFCSSA